MKELKIRKNVLFYDVFNEDVIYLVIKSMMTG